MKNSARLHFASPLRPPFVNSAWALSRIIPLLSEKREPVTVDCASRVSQAAEGNRGSFGGR